jgi:hypothetical protein
MEPNLPLALLDSYAAVLRLPATVRRSLEVYRAAYDAIEDHSIWTDLRARRSVPHFAGTWKNIVRAFRLMPALTEPILVYRGESSPREQVSELLTPLSTSYSYQVAQVFANYGRGTIFHITVPAGIPVIPMESLGLNGIEEHHHEKEVLLPPYGRLVPIHRERHNAYCAYLPEAAMLPEINQLPQVYTEHQRQHAAADIKSPS